MCDVGHDAVGRRRRWKEGEDPVSAGDLLISYTVTSVAGEGARGLCCGRGEHHLIRVGGPIIGHALA